MMAAPAQESKHFKISVYTKWVTNFPFKYWEPTSPQTLFPRTIPMLAATSRSYCRSQLGWDAFHVTSYGFPPVA